MRSRIRVTNAGDFEEACRLVHFLLFSPRSSEAIVQYYVNGLSSSFKASDGSSYRFWADTGGGTWDMASTPPGHWIEGGRCPSRAFMVSTIELHPLNSVVRGNEKSEIGPTL
jgi:hypothetical protein